MKIVLTGYRGTGKTSVGRLLALRLHLPFIDTDMLIEHRAGMDIPSIFQRFGEAYFRALERDVIASLRNARGVISTGGGAVCDPINVEHLRWNGSIVLLTASPEIIEGRIAGSDRPVLTDRAPGDEIRAMLRRRREAYLGAADICFDTGERTVEEVSDAICRSIRGRSMTNGQRRDRNELAGVLDLQSLIEQIDHDPALRICGIAGYPCAHSVSPLIYNRLFERFGMGYLYTRFQWPEVDTIIRLAKLLPLKGLSVTIPFKGEVMHHLDEVDRHAAAIGAANTVVRCGDRFFGFNTDWLGVRTPLIHRQGARGVVIGAGGAAAAAVYALLSLDMDVVVLNRTPEKARSLAAHFGCGWGPLDAFSGSDVDVVVHATSVGMEPDTRSLLDACQFDRKMTVFDLVYTPPETPLIRAARQAGCETIYGTEMFVHQAAEQFRLITGIAVSPELVREMLS